MLWSEHLLIAVFVLILTQWSNFERITSKLGNTSLKNSTIHQSAAAARARLVSRQANLTRNKEQPTDVLSLLIQI